MDQIIIGKFIASERKRKGYTQRQLADLLQISDKTISKWERGNGFPEVSLLLPLCRELDITVNELLSLSQRFEVASMLRNHKTYLEIADKTGASTATISRVNRSLNYGNDGYEMVFTRMENKESG